MARRKKQEAPAGSPAWMSTFSDLMNLLLCFFVMLFSMSNIDEAKFEEMVKSFQATFSIFDGGGSSFTDGVLISSGVSQLEELNDYYESMGENQDAQNQQIAESQEQYEEQKNQQLLISSNAYDFISKIGDILVQYDKQDIQIIGHTDSVPQSSSNKKYSDNMELSQGRAYSVYTYLKDNKGMDVSTMGCMGRGETSPIASNDTAEGRAQNRRVEIKIFNEYSSSNVLQ